MPLRKPRTRRLPYDTPARKSLRGPVYTPGFNMEDIAFIPTREERIFEWLQDKQAQWAREDQARRCKRLAEILAHVERDRAATERQEIVERELSKVQNYYASVLEEEAKTADTKRRAALDKIVKVVQRDRVRAEREVLTARGVVRGRMRRR
jgi:hypothetical protein